MKYFICFVKFKCSSIMIILNKIFFLLFFSNFFKSNKIFSGLKFYYFIMNFNHFSMIKGYCWLFTNKEETKKLMSSVWLNNSKKLYEYVLLLLFININNLFWLFFWITNTIIYSILFIYLSRTKSNISTILFYVSKKSLNFLAYDLNIFERFILWYLDSKKFK